MNKPGNVFIRSLRYICLVGVIAIGLISIVGCSGGGSSPSIANIATTGVISPDTLRFDIASSVFLMSQADLVTAASDKLQKLKRSGEPIFTYQKLSEMDGQKKSTGGGTNLIKVDASGNASLAVTSTQNVEITHSVLGSNGSYVYLSTGSLGVDIGGATCYLIRVKVADNSSACMFTIGQVSSNSYSIVSGDLKAVQFDGSGNLVLVSGGRLYQVNPTTKVATALTEDNVTVSLHAVLPSGEVAYTANGLNLYQNGQTIVLDSTDPSYFGVDQKETIFWAGTNGISVARTLETGGVERTTIDGSLNENVIIGDDGNLYQGTASLTRVLPYKAEEIIATSSSKVRVSKGWVYYTEETEVLNYGARDVIKMYRLEDGTTNTLLDGGDERYQIYNWQVSGRTLHFAARDLINSTVVTGSIDTIKVRDGSPESEYLTVTTAASAIGTISAINDIEVILPEEPETDTGMNPQILSADASTGTIKSVGYAFNKYMNKQSVEDNLTFVDSRGNNVAYVPLWFYQSLYLIPDASSNGVADATATPLPTTDQYTVTFGDNTLDAYGLDLASGRLGKTFTFPIGFSKIAAGRNHVITIRQDGTLWAWGYNSSSQLGDGTTTSRNYPVQIGSDSDWASISAGESHSLAIKTDGTLWMWGGIPSGEDGRGGWGSHTPVQIGSDSDWASISAGEFYSLAIKTNGSLWSWGRNDHGQLGDGTTSSKTSPQQVGSDSDWASTSLAVGGWNVDGLCSLALKTNGTIWSWGRNYYGQLGNGIYGEQSSPVQIGTDSDWSFIAMGVEHGVAIKTNGTLWIWGANWRGQLGDGTTTRQGSPVQLGSDSDWAFASTGHSHTLAIKTDGTLWGWGANGYSALGDGTGITPDFPIQIGTDSDWAFVYASDAFTVGMTEDSAFWAWGRWAWGWLGADTIPSLTDGGASVPTLTTY